MDVTFAFEPILSISVCPIGAPAQIVAPTTIEVGLVGIVLVGCEAGGTVLVHIAGFQGAEYDGCLVPYLLVLHVQSMIFID